MFNWVVKTPHESPVCVSYLAISMTIATLARCDQVSFEISFICSFSISKLPNLKQNLEKSSSFQHKLHQSPNMYNNHGNGLRVERSGCNDCEESFGNSASM